MQLPLNAAGLLRLRLLEVGSRVVEVNWVCGGDAAQNLPALSELRHLPHPEFVRVLRLCEVVTNQPSSPANCCARGVVAAAAQGSYALSYALMEAHCKGRWDVDLEVRCRAVTRSFWHRLRNGLLPSRMLSTDVLDLSDMNAGMAPYVVRHRNWLVGPQQIHVISGGDRLSPGLWLWRFGEDGVGEVLVRAGRHFGLQMFLEQIGIHLNHPRVEVTDGCSGGTRKQVGLGRSRQVYCAPR